MPIGEAKIKRMNIARVQGSFHFILFDWKVEPTEQATGILWIMTPAARTASSSASLKAPIAKPSMPLWRIIAIPKVARV